MVIEELLKLLNEHKVDFVIIGATAFPVYGYVRATLDTDIFIRPEKSNAEKTMAALKQLGYDTYHIFFRSAKRLKIDRARIFSDNWNVCSPACIISILLRFRSDRALRMDGVI